MTAQSKGKVKAKYIIKKPNEICKKSDDNQQVKYGNELNEVPFKRFKAVEMNLFFSIVSQMRDRDTQTIRFPFSNLKKISRYAHGDSKRFVQDLKNTYHKMLALTIYNQAEGDYDEWVLFTHFHISSKKKFVDISVNPDPHMQTILNNISRWTRFSLLQFNNLKSSYSKTIFRLCKQYRTTGILFLWSKQFKDQLGIPKSYQNRDIDRRVLNLAKLELRHIWPEFDYGKRKSKKRGHKVLGYYFVWNKEAKNNRDIVNPNYNNDFSSDWNKKKTSRKSKKVYAKENPKKVGSGKKIHKISNSEVQKALKGLKN